MKHIESKCPVCGHTINASKALDGSDELPCPSDVSICFSCSAILMFNDDLTTRRMDIEELLQLPDDVQNDLREALVAIWHVKQQGTLQ